MPVDGLNVLHSVKMAAFAAILFIWRVFFIFPCAIPYKQQFPAAAGGVIKAGRRMKMTLRTKLIVFVVALAVLITCAMTVGSYLQMRSQLIDVSIKNEITNAASDTSRLIKSWIDVHMSIVTAGVETLPKADDPLPGIIQTAKSGHFQAAYLGSVCK